jgi:hypothetical protein
MRILLRVVLTALLTVPVFLVLTKIDAVPAWLFSENGYAALSPLFSLFGAVGVEGHEGVVAGVLLFASFIVAAIIVFAVAGLVRRVRTQGAIRH